MPNARVATQPGGALLLLTTPPPLEPALKRRNHDTFRAIGDALVEV